MMRVDRTRRLRGRRRPILCFLLAIGFLAIFTARWALEASTAVGHYAYDLSASSMIEDLRSRNQTSEEALFPLELQGAAAKELVKAEKATTARRLFLAIQSHRMADSRLRNVLRKTYLSFDSKKYTAFAESPSICSLKDFLEMLAASSGDEKKDDKTKCQVVYAFFIKGVTKDEPEFDVVYLGLPKDQPRNELLATLHYARDLAANHTDALDYVAATNNHVVVEPTRLWEASLFQAPLSHARLYGGITEDPTAAPTVVLQHYLLLSTRLLPGVLEHPQADVVGLPNDASERTVSQILEQLHGPNSPDPLPRLLWQPVPVVVHEKYDYLSFVYRWDEYKDREVVTYQDAFEEAQVRANDKVNQTLGTCLHGPRVLLGIMTTMDSPKEKKRRRAIRETYLQFFHDTKHPRICSLNELISPSKGRKELLLQECQLAYVFVVGANPEGPTERVVVGPSSPLTIPPPADVDTADEEDLIYLNIKENMKEGKSQTFLKYATTVVDEHVYFDYIAKTDTDTLIIPDRFLDRNINLLPRFPNNVRIYGGSPRVKEEIGHLIGPTYNQGLLYFLSIDLARYVTSQACPRQDLKVFSEDKSIGNFIHSHELPIRRVKLEVVPRCYHHPLKDIQEFREHWREYA